LSITLNLGLRPFMLIATDRTATVEPQWRREVWIWEQRMSNPMCLSKYSILLENHDGVAELWLNGGGRKCAISLRNLGSVAETRRGV
jgi:hypothetical protein